MRYPDGHKEAVRASIVASASEALRRDGLAGVSIPELMRTAGLTHGGFYVHFANRDELVAEAVMAGAQQTASRILANDTGDLDDTLRAYLSKEHVAHPEAGCVLAALGGEGRRQPAPIRDAFARAAKGFVGFIDQKLRKPRRGAAPSDDALRLSAQMIGAVVLARLVDDDALAARILEAAKRRP